MARIFISFYNGVADPLSPLKMPLFYEGFIKGLEQAGHSLMVCSRNVFFQETPPSCPPQLVSQIRAFRPDFALLFNNCFYHYDFEKELGIPVFIYSVDSALYFSDREFIRQNLGKFRFVTNEGTDVKALFGADDSSILKAPFFTSVVAEEREIESNISFIGSHFPYGNILRDFIARNPGAEERRQFEAYERLIVSNPFISFDELQRVDGIPAFCKESDRINETVFYISSKNRIETLNAVAPLGLRLYGTPSWIQEFNFYPDVTKAYRAEPIYSIRHNQDVYNTSRIGINIPHVQALNNFPWRVVDVMASNALLISAKMNAYAATMPEITVPQFESSAEAYDLCKKYLNDEEARRDLVASHQDLIEKRYRFCHFLSAFEDFSGISLNPAEKPAEPAVVEEPCYVLDYVAESRRKPKSPLHLALSLLRSCFYPKKSGRYRKILTKVASALKEALAAE